MKQTLNLIILLLIPLFFTCDNEKLLIEADEEETVSPSELLPSDSCITSTICVPPTSIDTCCVSMQMLQDSILYKPVANFSCIMNNFFLNIDQIWINGSIIFSNKVVTLRMPTDITIGTYPLLFNTAYDAFYVPAIGADNFIAISGSLTITLHDIDNKFITGSFHFIAENQQSPVIPKIEFTEGCFAAHY